MERNQNNIDNNWTIQKAHWLIPQIVIEKGSALEFTIYIVRS